MYELTYKRLNKTFPSLPFKPSCWGKALCIFRLVILFKSAACVAKYVHVRSLVCRYGYNGRKGKLSCFCSPEHVRDRGGELRRQFGWKGVDFLYILYIRGTLVMECINIFGSRIFPQFEKVVRYPSKSEKSCCTIMSTTVSSVSSTTILSVIKDILLICDQVAYGVTWQGLAVVL